MSRRSILFLFAVVTVGFVAMREVVVAENPKPKPDSPVPATKPDDAAPHAFPDIKPLNSDGVAAFVSARFHLLRASADDLPTVRLNKAKLRLAIQAIHFNFQLSAAGKYEVGVLPGMGRAVRDATQAVGELWPAVDDQRPWLEMLVGVQHYVEELVMARARAGAGAKLDAGPLLNRDVVTAQAARLDAELALLKLGQNMDNIKDKIEERKVLKPHEVERDRPQQSVTVAFQVETVSRLRGQIAEGQPPYEPIKLDATAKLKDERNKLYVVLVGKALAQVYQLGIDPVTHFQGRTIEVTGKIQYHTLPRIMRDGKVEIPADSYTHYEIVVDSLDNLRVVENEVEEADVDPKAANPQDLTHAEAAKLGITIEVKEIKPRVNFVTINFTVRPKECMVVIQNKSDWIASTAMAEKDKSGSAWLAEEFTTRSYFLITTNNGKRVYRIPVRARENERKDLPKQADSAELVRNVIAAMEGFRHRIPDAEGLAEQNGLSVKETEPYLLTHLEGVARRLKVETRAECLALLTYLKDPDGKIREIAIQAIEGVVKSRPDGMSIEVLTDTKSDAHQKMVAKFVELIEKLPSEEGDGHSRLHGFMPLNLLPSGWNLAQTKRFLGTEGFEIMSEPLDGNGWLQASRAIDEEDMYHYVRIEFKNDYSVTVIELAEDS